MTEPTSDEIVVATSALLAEAALWIDSRDHLEIGEARARAARLPYYTEMAIFGPVVAAYDEAAETVALRCHEGARTTAAVGFTLQSVAEIYRWEEDRNYHALRGLY